MSDQPELSHRSHNRAENIRAFISSLMPQRRWVAAGFVIVFLLLFVQLADAGGRRITINGYALSEQEIAYLDGVVGGQVPDGDYWLDPATMAWGVMGNPQPMGVVGYGGGQAQTPQQWYGVGQNYRGPFGDYMSDGQCSFVNGVAVGNC